DVVGFLLVALDHGEHTEGLPFFRVGRLGGLSHRGDVRGLRGVLLGRGNRLAVVVDLVVLVDHGGAVVVDYRVLGIAAEGGDGGVGARARGGGGGRAGGGPAAGGAGFPAGFKIVVAAEAGAAVTGLGAARCGAAVGGGVSGGAADGDAARRGGVAAVGVGR